MCAPLRPATDKSTYQKFEQLSPSQKNTFCATAITLVILAAAVSMITSRKKTESPVTTVSPTDNEKKLNSDRVIVEVGKPFVHTFTPPITLTKIELGDYGTVEWNGQKVFEEIFAITPPIALPEHSIQPPSVQASQPTQSFDGAFQLGRSKYDCHSKITQKTRKTHESKEVMAKEAAAQAFLHSKKDKWGLRSTFPTPVHWNDQQLFYKTPEGYHTYLTDIDDYETFQNSLLLCAHDLGRLLHEGIAYPELISVFHQFEAELHDELKSKGARQVSRIYTIFPWLFGHKGKVHYQDGSEGYGTASGGQLIFGGFPGAIEKVVKPDHHLYPNLGVSGLRDLGDYITINEFITQIQGLNLEYPIAGFAERTFTQAGAFGHFISLYQLVFMLIIAKRGQRLNRWDQKEVATSFCEGCHALITSFLQLKGDHSEQLGRYITAMINPKRFSQQMQFCFTTEDRSTLWQHTATRRAKTGTILIEETPPDRFSSDRARLPTHEIVQEIWGDHAKWYLDFGGMYGGSLIVSSYNPETGFKEGELGNHSAPNPLLEGCLAIFNLTYFTLKNLHAAN